MTSSTVAAATIFSLTRAPPRPFTRSRLGSTSSAPSIVGSSLGWSFSSPILIPTDRPRDSDSLEVGMPTMSAPSLTRSPISLMAMLAVEPLPSPTTMPLFTSLTASRAAISFRSNASRSLRSPLEPEVPRDKTAEFLDDIVVDPLAVLGRCGLRIAHPARRYVLLRIVEYHVLRWPRPARGPLPADELRPYVEHPRCLDLARVSVVLGELLAPAVVRDVVVREHHDLDVVVLLDGPLRAQPERGHMAAPRMTSEQQYLLDAVPRKLGNDVEREPLVGLEAERNGPREVPRAPALAIPDWREQKGVKLDRNSPSHLLRLHGIGPQ